MLLVDLETVLETAYNIGRSQGELTYRLMLACVEQRAESEEEKQRMLALLHDFIKIVTT